MKQNPWLKWVCVVLTAALSIGILYTLWDIRQSQKAESARLEALSAEYSVQLRPLREKKAGLERQLYQLTQNHQEEKDTTSYIILLVTEPDKRIFTDVLPLVKQYGYPGAVALGENTLPGAADCLNVNQLNQLVTAGWEVCLSADASTDIAALEEKVTDLGFAPNAVYFPDNDCTPVQSLKMQQMGLSARIGYGKSVTSEMDGQLLSIRAYGSNEVNAKSVFNSAVNSSTVLALTVGYQNSREKFNEDNFGNMLSTVAGSVKAEKCRVAGINSVSEMYRDNIERWEKLEKQYRIRRAELETQLEEVTRQIQAIQ